MSFIDIKHRMHDERILNVISHSLYKPTPEQLNNIAGQCEQDPAMYAFAHEENGSAFGAVVLADCGGGEFEILHIATDPAHRKQGVASGLISNAISVLQCAVIKAETDDDAVEFYRKYGFRVISLGEKYPSVTRYRCTLKLR